MDQKSLIAWRKNPNLIGKNEVQELENLLQEFPYFSLGQILLAKGYKNLNHYKLEEQIKKATFYCEDREWFYHFINSSIEAVETVSVKPSASRQGPIEKAPEPIVEEKPIQKKEPVVLPVKEEPKKVLEVIKEQPSVKETIVVKKTEEPFKLKKESAWKKESKVATPLLKKVEEKLEKAADLPADRQGPIVKKKEEKLEVKAEPIVAKKRGRPPKVKTEEVKAEPKRREGSPKVKVEEVKAEPKKKGRPPKAKLGAEKVKREKKEVAPKVIEKETTEQPIEGKKKIVKKSKKLSKKKKAKKKAKVVLDEKSLLDELLRGNIQYNLEDHYSVEEEKSVQEETKVEEGPHDFFAWLKTTDSEEGKVESKKQEKKVEQKVQKKVTTKPHKSLNTIDKFLSNKTVTKKKKASFFSPIEMAKRSDNIEGEIVSETLAEVYEGQERYPEAILTYEKLILLFPQKETYFATRIKNLRKLDLK